MNNKYSLLTRFFFLFVAMFMGALPTIQASAALVKCRTDPIFTLSNGDVITVTLDISTDATNIKALNYILHIPAGVNVTSVVFTGGFEKIETYKILQDSPAKTYTTDSFATTATRVPVTGKTTVSSSSAGSSFSYSNSTSTYTTKHIIVTVKKP